MNQSINSTVNQSTHSNDGTNGHAYHENFVILTPEKELLKLNEPHQTSEGTWSEFVGDLKFLVKKIGTDTQDKIETVGEWCTNLIHRKARVDSSNTHFTH